jgi:hypothetical protein
MLAARYETFNRLFGDNHRCPSYKQPIRLKKKDILNVESLSKETSLRAL